MAAGKETITQRDFSLGAVRPEAVERDDTALVQQSTKVALNTIKLTTGAIEGRPGTVHVGSTDAKRGVEVDLGAGRVYDIHVVPDGVIIYGSDGAAVATFLGNTWDDLTNKYGTDTFDDSEFWVVPDPDTSSILIGAQAYPVHALLVDGTGTWSFGEFAYATTGGTIVNQPYWNYYPGVTIAPSALSGSITVTASDGIWTDAHEGLRIRYVDQEIVLGTRVSDTVINATVTESLPPTKNFTVSDGSGYRIGDAVEDDGLGGQGIITNVAGGTITVLTTAFWASFSTSNRLVAPNANLSPSAISNTTPAATEFWDIQIASAIHGFPGWCERHNGRTYFNRFPNAPGAYAVSAAGKIDDFSQGVEDGDGFVEKMGANAGGDLLYIISGEDLLFLTTRGLYYQRTRGQQDVTPQNIAPIEFSSMGVSQVSPIAVDDGIVFVDAVGQQVWAAILTGTVDRSWLTRNISKDHNHLISSPVNIGATVSGSENPEAFIYVVNSDGTAAICQWDVDEGVIGWRPWSTDGRFLAIYQAFGKIQAIVDRSRTDFTARFRERFVTGIYMDCVAALEKETGSNGTAGNSYFGGVTALADHLYGLTVTVFYENWDMGDRQLSVAGRVLDENGQELTYPDTGLDVAFVQVGLPFTWTVTPWARLSVNTQRGTRPVKKMTHLFITVQDTLTFACEGQEFGGYRVDENLDVPPSLRSTEYKVVLGGRAAFLDRPISFDRPGPVRILKLRYRVVI